MYLVSFLSRAGPTPGALRRLAVGAAPELVSEPTERLEVLRTLRKEASRSPPPDVSDQLKPASRKTRRRWEWGHIPPG
jgi:hypothetical protein